MVECNNFLSGGGIGVLLGNDDGIFQPPATYGSGGYVGLTLMVGDVNGDGNLFQLGVRDAELPAPNRSHTCDGRVLKLVAKGVFAGPFQSRPR